MTSFPEIWNDLARDFHPRQIRERPVGKGDARRMVKYITARSAMNRLDAVLGWENWEDSYERDPGGSDNIVCRLSVRLPDGRVVTKADAGAPSAIGDDGDDDKGAFSDAFKRACVKFGIGRSLYGDGCFVAEEPEKGPGEATPPAGPGPAPPEAPAPVAAIPQAELIPRTGKQLLAWVQRREEEPQYAGLGRHLAGWGKDQNFPKLFKDYEPWMVAEAYGQACAIVEDLEVEYHSTVASR